MRNIAMFGGTFNPIHKGHINLCNQINSYYNFDKIIIIPSNIPPHKKVEYLATNTDRIQMCELAIQDNPLFCVSDIEIQLKGVSYTINTIKQLKKVYADANLYLIIGSDMLYMFERWKSYEEILENVTVICGARYDEEYEKMMHTKSLLLENLNTKLKDKIDIVKINVMILSSTFIREQLKLGHSWEEYLPSRVYQYINEKSLY